MPSRSKEVVEMLILTRRIGESIIINDDIMVKIVDVQGSQVRLGIEAPSSIDIYREEIYKRINSTLKKCSEPLVDSES